MQSELIVELEPICHGGFGSIYNCKHRGKNLIAKKIPLLPNGFIDKPMEFVIMGSRIPHINKHLGVMFDDKSVYILQERGKSLKLSRKDTIPEYNTMLKWCKVLLTSIKHLHRYEFIHCDIKPDNILIVNGEPVLADLGLVTISQGNYDRSIGTSSYRAPEVWNKKEKSTSLDIWSLGLTFYYLIQGNDLFQLESHISDKDTKKKLYREQLDEWITSYPKYPNFKLHKSHKLYSIVLSMLNPDPQLRPTANEILKNEIFSNVSIPKNDIMEIHILNNVNTDIYVRWIYELIKTRVKDEIEGLEFSLWFKNKIANGKHTDVPVELEERYKELERWLVCSKCHVPKI